MKLPPLIFALGYAGLIPFLIGPAWHAFAPASAPSWLDALWLSYATLIASFMAGTFWGMALIAAEGPEGQLGMVMSAVLMLLTWLATALPLRLELIALAVVFALLALAEVWRERVLDPLSGYFSLRITLTIGVCIAIGWRLAIGLPAA